MNLIERLKTLEAAATPYDWESPEVFKYYVALHKALPKLLAVVEAAKRQVDKFPEDCQEDLMDAVWALEEKE